MKNQKKEENKKEISIIYPIYLKKRTYGERSSDKLTQLAGSWSFIFIALSLIALWIIVNVYAWIQQWDPYPFILLNLILSVLAALQAPVILMSQNRQSQTDRTRAEYDYSTNRRTAREIISMQKQLDRIENKLRKS